MTSKSDALDRFRVLMEDLERVRRAHNGYSSSEEDRIVDEMDVVWWELSEEEQEIVEVEMPKTLIR